MLSFFVFVLSILGVCFGHGDLTIIWYDSMDNITSHWITQGAGPSQYEGDSSNTYCTTSLNCVSIGGYLNGSDWVTRTTALQLINIDMFSSFLIQFDVTLYNMESTNYCKVKYKYNTESAYKTVKSYGGLDSTATIPIQKINETEVIVIEPTATSLNIRLETDGDSSTGNDYCFFDNVYLYGNWFNDSEVIWFDSMSDISEWTLSTNAYVNSISQITLDYTYCSSGGDCVEIRGYEDYDNAIVNSVENIDLYSNLIIEFDTFLRNMEIENGCQLLYAYDTDPSQDWYLLSSIGGGNDDQYYRHQIVTIHENPSFKSSTILWIKLQNNGDDSSGNDYCYFDNIYVLGTPINGGITYDYFGDTNQGYDKEQYKHVIIMGDMGGQASFPYYTSQQVTTADMLSTISHYYDISGIITLGDNIYSSGVDDEFDTRFQTSFEDIYWHSNLVDINWYLTSGNHDYRKNITGEIEYSKHSDRWNYPSHYYTKTWHFANGIELLFVALDTYILCGSVTDSSTNHDCIPPDSTAADIHWQWLNDTLKTHEKATFKVVGGHTPIYSYAAHGPTTQLIDNLIPLLDYHGVNAYVFGHDHVVQYIEDNDASIVNSTLHYIGSGAGHGCRDSFTNINSEWNPSLDSLKYMDCNQMWVCEIND